MLLLGREGNKMSKTFKLHQDEILDLIVLYQAGAPIMLDKIDKAVEKLAQYQKTEKQMLVLYDIVTDMPTCFEDFLNEEQRTLFDIDEG